MTLTGGKATDRGIALALVTGLLSITLPACGSSPATPASPASASSVVSAPVRIARTTAGPVGYRMVGSGPTLVLVMGYAGTMEVWDPRFVDALARHCRVVIFVLSAKPT